MTKMWRNLKWSSRRKQSSLLHWWYVQARKKRNGKQHKKEWPHKEMFIVQIGIFLYIMSHQVFIQNILPGNDPEGCSEVLLTKETSQCLPVAFEPVDWLEQKWELNLQTPVPLHVGRAEYPKGVGSGAYPLSPLEVLNKCRWWQR